MNTITIANRGAAGEIETSAMANCLMLLSAHSAAMNSVVGNTENEAVGRMFACKTCDRKFSSFQALGGHRASHKKIKTPNSGEFPDDVSFPAKSKVHSCKICGVEFPTGQALGGHMRRHRETLSGGVGGGSEAAAAAALSSVTTEGSSGNSDGNNDGGEKKRKINDVVSEVPVMMKSSSCKRVCLDLDLDLGLWKKLEENNTASVAENNKLDEDYEIEEGEIVEQHHEKSAAKNNVNEEKDFLKLELRQPINCW